MMGDLKLEVGKRYETRDGRVAFVSFDAGDRIWGIIEGSNGTKIWTQDGCVWGGIQNHHLDLIRCLDDEPELADLTKIDVPFGALDERTQDRLAGASARGAQIQAPDGLGWSTVTNPSWHRSVEYRVKPTEPTYTMPTVDATVWLAMPGAKAIAWDSCGTDPHAYDAVPTPTPLYKEWDEGDRVCIMRLELELFGDLIQRGDCPWDQAIVLRPDGL